MEKTEIALVGFFGLSAAVIATLLLGRAVAAAPRYPPAQFEYIPDIPVDKRGVGAEPIHNFIRPDEVADLYASLGSTLACYDWVCRNIAKVADPIEYWQYPLETVERGAGDCEDNAFLLTSLIRNEEEAYAVLGWFVYQYQAWGHCWVTCRQCVFEPTLMEMPMSPWQREEEMAAYYIPMLYLTESEIYALTGYPELITPYYGYLPDKRQALEEFWRRRQLVV
ncbi:hypothetical protein ES703_110106 [subsurface metagenome]